MNGVSFSAGTAALLACPQSLAGSGTTGIAGCTLGMPPDPPWFKPRPADPPSLTLPLLPPLPFPALPDPPTPALVPALPVVSPEPPLAPSGLFESLHAAAPSAVNSSQCGKESRVEFIRTSRKPKYDPVFYADNRQASSKRPAFGPAPWRWAGSRRFGTMRSLAPPEELLHVAQTCSAARQIVRFRVCCSWRRYP